jgi:hypothetical protein
MFQEIILQFVFSEMVEDGSGSPIFGDDYIFLLGFLEELR